MQHDDMVYVKHMLERAQRIKGKTEEIDRVAFDNDENLRLAVTYLLQVIGEAASRVSPDFRRAHSQLEWKAIIGMRQKVVHDYMNVDDDIVWTAAIEDIPSLIPALESILEA